MPVLAILARLELRRLLAGRAVVAGLLLFLLAGAYGLHHGRTVVERQRAALALSPTLEREQAEYLARLYPAATTEAGSVLYYRFFHTRHEPTAWSAASLGLRDVNPYNLKVRLLTLQGQLYDSELANPTTLAAGNIDLAFVAVFLLPLLVIALTYNLRSEEEEGDTWRLLWAQPVPVTRVLALKAAVRLGVLLAVVATLLACAVAWLRLPWDARLATAGALILSYTLFWFAVALCVVSLRRSSDVNALTLVGTWLALTIVAPALLNVVAAARFPLPESLELTVRQRQGYHESWDLPKQATMAPFLARRPALAAHPVPEDRFSWGWYYAMNERGDVLAAPAATEYRQGLRQRDAWMRRIALAVPPLGLQLALDRLAGTDLRSSLAYLESVEGHHAALREALYPAVFADARVAQVDWDALPRHHFTEEGARPALGREVAALLGGAGVLALLAAWRLGRGGQGTSRRRTVAAGRAAQPASAASSST